MDGHFPKEWRSITIAGVHYLYGITALGNPPYAVYVSDMTSVWFTSPSKKEVYEKAIAHGISDFDDSKLAFFVGELVKLFGAQSQSLRFSRKSDVLFTIDVTVAENIPWTFQLKLADASETASFFRSLCLSSFANHGYLVYKVSQLEHLIRARDKYTMYLEENYKTVNGMELMEKYKRQHVDDARLLAKYERESSNLRIRSMYRNYLTKKNLDIESQVWDNINVALKDTSTWRANLGETTESLVDAKNESYSRQGSQDSKLGLGTIPKLDSQKRKELSSSPVRSQHSSSPTKRRRVGSGRR